MATPIYIPSLVGGVSQLPQSQRDPQTVEVADNVELNPVEGVSKRPGTEHIAGEAADESLDATNPTQDVYIGWFDRDDGEQFVVVINPNLDAVHADVIQIFNLDGEKQTVNYDTADPRPYLTDMSTTAVEQMFRLITVADGIFVLNRTVTTERTGDEITYRANAADLRQTSNPNNLPTWWDFPQPPDGTVTPPDSTESDYLFYAQQDEAGLPQGFYRAISTTAPPWYERVRTEPANSEVDESTMPIRIDFDGTAFTAAYGDYKPRRAGDDLVNPAASFFANNLSDLVFFQNRLWFTSLEQIVASRAGALLNFWQDSPTIRTDRDYIDLSISENRVSNIDHVVPFQDNLILFTRANKQFQLGAQGAYSPNTVFMRPIGNYNSVPYASPTTMGGMLIFASEQNFFNTLWAYAIDPETEMPRFDPLSMQTERYIPATLRRMVASERHGKLFVSTRAEPHNLYVWERGAWTRWVFDEDTEIISHQSFGDFLYLLIRRDDKLWMEKVAIGTPEDDVIEVSSGVFQTMGFSVRLDRKMEIQGVYDPDENETTFTLPYVDEKVDTIFLGPTWDTGEGANAVRLAGTLLTPTVSEVSGQTVLTVEGQWAKNAEGEDAIAYVGRNYEMRIRLNKQFVRDPENRLALFGNTQLLSGRLRFRNTVYFRVEVTPLQRPTRKTEFYFPRVGSTPFDGEYVKDHGELFFRILGKSEDTIIEIVNDLPVPSTLVDGFLDAKFVSQGKSPT